MIFFSYTELGWRLFNLIHLFSFLESNNYHFLISTFSNTRTVHSSAPYPYPLYPFRFLYSSNCIPHYCFQPLVLIFLKYTESILSILNHFFCDFTNLMNSAPFNVFPVILIVSFQEVQWAEWIQFAILNQMMCMLHTFVWLTAWNGGKMTLVCYKVDEEASAKPGRNKRNDYS